MSFKAGPGARVDNKKPVQNTGSLFSSYFSDCWIELAQTYYAKFQDAIGCYYLDYITLFDTK
jgi:hypothetical protein